MLTILIWLGSGFAFAVGVISGVALNTSRMKKVEEDNKRFTLLSIDALRQRNSIGDRQAATMDGIENCLARIADAVEDIELEIRDFNISRQQSEE